ncbi:MAG: cytochrome-c oxidase, cbb3-type subunit III [Alphaproteobacteria bacterium]|nr:MAG: cytochrome-c oxidase, cbb3-type subunit III [Alphaproteobacteria bacterium]
MSKKAKNQVGTTGHVWDGDLEELNNPLPRWWLWIFYATIVFAIGYTILYPAWPLPGGETPGLLHKSTRADVAAEIARFKAMNAEIEAKLASADLTTIKDDPELYSYALQSGAATFATYCSQCHGSGAAGAKGYPNLLDNDWLWGGTIEDVAYTIRHGVRNNDDEDARYSQMPAFGKDEILSEEEIDQVVNYVRSLSGLPDVDPALAEAGATVFADNCAACHGEDGKGDRAQGAPNLTDAIWLYGSDFDTIKHNVENGPFGVMPAWGMNPNFDDARINAVAAYVHSLGGGE